MKIFKFVSHEKYSEDPYIKESVYLCFNDSLNVLYVRKTSKNGGLFWTTANQSVIKNGEKIFLESVSQDSKSLEKEVKSFLEKREWENLGKISTDSSYSQDVPF